ncbi:MAG TPA: RluA family pseudouridine synthase [Bacteroidetes bacterium]|nr:RluA family pseudouridine synthase [Bacteroidota bacterium]
MNEPDILYEDNHLIAVNKPAGVLSQGDRTNDKTLADDVKAYLKNKYNKPGDVFLGIIHRLDRPVSGLILFARTSKALSRCTQLFRDRNINKTYLALVENHPDKPIDELVHFLVKNNKNNTTSASTHQSTNSKKSILQYEHIGSYKNTQLLRLRPLTGRSHQIRVQLAFIGCPIINDMKYGFPKSDNKHSIYLHSASLEFEHPVKKEKLILKCPMPKDRLWGNVSSLYA